MFVVDRGYSSPGSWPHPGPRRVSAGWFGRFRPGVTVPDRGAIGTAVAERSVDTALAQAGPPGGQAGINRGGTLRHRVPPHPSTALQGGVALTLPAALHNARRPVAADAHQRVPAATTPLHSAPGIPSVSSWLCVRPIRDQPCSNLSQRHGDTERAVSPAGDALLEGRTRVSDWSRSPDRVVSTASILVVSVSFGRKEFSRGAETRRNTDGHGQGWRIARRPTGLRHERREPGGARQLGRSLAPPLRTGASLDCGGRAKRRHRFGGTQWDRPGDRQASTVGARSGTGLLHTLRLRSKAAWR